MSDISKWFRNIFIIDNNSSDGTRESLEVLKVTRGINTAFSDVEFEQKGVELSNWIKSRGSQCSTVFPLDIDEFIALMDDDIAPTVVEPGQKMVEYVQRLPPVTAAYRVRIIRPHQDSFDNMAKDPSPGFGNFTGTLDTEGWWRDGKVFFQTEDTRLLPELDMGNHVHGIQKVSCKVALVHRNFRSEEQLRKNPSKLDRAWIQLSSHIIRIGVH